MNPVSRQLAADDITGPCDRSRQYSYTYIMVGEEQEQAAGQIVLLCIGQQILTGHNNNNIRIVEFLHFEIDTGICNYI